jgi:CheY-like chemotaxis protein
MIPDAVNQLGGRVPAGGTILVVDDDPMVRGVIHTALCRGGYRVIDGGGAAEALRLVEDHDHSIELLLTDIEMPGMNGIELARRMRLVRPELKVLFMSGASKSDAVGGQPFIGKPFTLNGLLSTVKGVLVTAASD